MAEEKTEEKAREKPEEKAQEKPEEKAQEKPNVKASEPTLEEKNLELYDQLLRAKAEFENFRKRVDREKAELALYAKTRSYLELLPLYDVLHKIFDLGSASLHDGVIGEQSFRSPHQASR